MPPTRPSGPVPGLFERQSINLIIGSSKAGKTSLLLNQLERYATGYGFLNYVAEPVQMGLIACSRTQSKILHALAKYPFVSDQTRFPIEMWRPDETKETDAEALERTFNKLNSLLPPDRPIKLLIVEDLQSLMTSGKILEIKTVKSFCLAIHAFCDKHDVAILGTINNTKMKSGERYPQLADRIPGTSCWGPEMDTLIGIERTKLHRQPEDQDGLRRILVQTQNAADEVHWGKFLEDGFLNVSPDYIPIDEDTASMRFLDEKLARAKPGSEWKKKDLDCWGAEKNIHPKTVTAWATARMNEGLLNRTGFTNKLRYHKPLEQ